MKLSAIITLQGDSRINSFKYWRVATKYLPRNPAPPEIKIVFPANLGAKSFKSWATFFISSLIILLSVLVILVLVNIFLSILFGNKHEGDCMLPKLIMVSVSRNKINESGIFNK